MFPIFAGWSGEQGSLLLKRLGSIGLRSRSSTVNVCISKFQLNRLEGPIKCVGDFLKMCT